jgi:hypothetical protein
VKGPGFNCKALAPSRALPRSSYDITPRSSSSGASLIHPKCLKGQPFKVATIFVSLHTRLVV